jgi:hypothetical protein
MKLQFEPGSVTSEKSPRDANTYLRILKSILSSRLKVFIKISVAQAAVLGGGEAA